MTDYFAVAVELLLRAHGITDARERVERYYETQTLDLQDFGFEHWELRTIRGVTTPQVREINLQPSPPFRGKFKDEKSEPATTKEIEDVVDKLFKKRGY